MSYVRLKTCPLQVQRDAEESLVEHDKSAETNGGDGGDGGEHGHEDDDHEAAIAKANAEAEAALAAVHALGEHDADSASLAASCFDEEVQEEWARRRKEAELLLYECHEGHADAVAGLLDLGADVNVRSPKNGALPLHLACRQGHRDVARLLVQRGAAIDEAMSGGYTALYIACQQGDLEVVSFLIDNGADMEKPKVSACFKGRSVSHFRLTMFQRTRSRSSSA